MYYTVTARLIPETAADFLTRLTDGSIENQKPDGKEIVASMNRAVIGEDGVIRWSETCYCATPMAHERETVYDQHFIDFETEEVDGYVQFEGESFMAYLQQLAD